MKMYGGTDKGLVRSSNQDSFYLDNENNWAVVADGMGGHRGGETASTMAVDIIKEEMAKKVGLKASIEKANELIFEKSIIETELNGMGTTVVLCNIVGNVATIAHVGDSRAYIVKDKKMKQITTDHSIVQQLIDSGTITYEQAKYHPQRNLITRAVGTEKKINIDINTIQLDEDDIILICSDGLSSYVDEKDILDIILNNDADKSVEELIKKANDCGGRDNITVVLVRA